MLKPPTYKKFDLKPRYWDPKKEEREARERKAKAELGIFDDDESYKPNIKGQFRRELNSRHSNRANQNISRVLRIFMILMMLFMAAFYIYIKNPDGLFKLFGL